MKNTLLNTLNKAPLAAMLLALLAVTAAREIALFTSFAGNGADTALAVAFALALVIAKPLMAAAAKQQSRRKNKPLAAACWLLVVPLLLLSVASTIAYFEYAYQVQATAEKQNSSAYQNTAALIAGKQKTAEQLKRTAAEAERAGNSWNAGELLRESREIESEVQALQQELATMPAAATSAATVSGDRLGGYRWLAWAAVSVVADLLQIVAVLLLNEHRKEQNSRQNSEQKTEQKEQNKTTENKQTEQPEQNKKQNGEQKHGNSVAPGEQTTGNWLAEQISATGQLPTVREAKAAGVNYGSYTDQIQQLLAAGVIQQKASGKGWQVAAA